MTERIIIIGGGIVGVCSALEAQRSGLQVTLIDRLPPGRATSFGNAGVLSESSVTILNNPRLLTALPKLLLNTSASFRYRPLFVLKNLPWFIKFLSYCNTQHLHHAGFALRALMQLSIARHKELISESKAENIFRTQGWLKLFRTQKSFQKFKHELEMFDKTQVPYTIFEREQIRQIEPRLAPIYQKGVLLDDTCGVSNPAALTDAYLKLFLNAGGQILQEQVTALHQPKKGQFKKGQSKNWVIQTASKQNIIADKIVIAAGPWSAEIAAWLGYNIPMKWERGYHRHLAPENETAENGEGENDTAKKEAGENTGGENTGGGNEGRGKHGGHHLNRAIHDIDGGYVLAPMQSGIRITTGVEIADRDAPPDFTQIERATLDARTHHNFGAPLDTEPWMGRRPTIVDSLPMIGRAPRHQNLLFNFGHQHIGLSTAPASALIITALLKDESPPINAKPFSPNRLNI